MFSIDLKFSFFPLKSIFRVHTIGIGNCILVVMQWIYHSWFFLFISLCSMFYNKWTAIVQMYFISRKIYTLLKHSHYIWKVFIIIMLTFFFYIMSIMHFLIFVAKWKRRGFYILKRFLHFKEDCGSGSNPFLYPSLGSGWSNFAYIQIRSFWIRMR